MNYVLGFSLNWDAIGAIASAIASLAALCTIFISIKNDRQNSEDQQYTVQPWFHITSTSRMGGASAIQLIVLNDASPNIKIRNVKLIVDNDFEEGIELEYKYLKKDDRFSSTGKSFEIIIPNDSNLFGQAATIEIHYSNLYKKQMKSISPNFNFIEKQDENTFLDIHTERFLYIPFSNEVV